VSEKNAVRFWKKEPKNFPPLVTWSRPCFQAAAEGGVRETKNKLKVIRTYVVRYIELP